MARYTLRRMVGGVITLTVVSVIIFWIIELPAGDAADIYLAKKFQGGSTLTLKEIAAVRESFGLNSPFIVRWWDWISGIIFHWNFGQSLANETPVNKLIGDRMLLTTIIIFATLFLTYALAIPIGVYSAVRRYSITDYTFTGVGYIGLALPNFLFALILLWVSVRYFGSSVGGLFSPQYKNAGWSFPKLFDLLRHMWVPVIVLGTANLAFQLQTVPRDDARRSQQALCHSGPCPWCARDAAHREVSGTSGPQSDHFHLRLRHQSRAIGCTRSGVGAGPARARPTADSLPA